MMTATAATPTSKQPKYMYNAIVPIILASLTKYKSILPHRTGIVNKKEA